MLGPLSEQGEPIVGYEAQRHRWQQLLAALLQGSVVDREDLLGRDSVAPTFEVDQDLIPIVEEALAVISKQSSGRAPGGDGIVAEVLKVGVAVMAEIIHPLIVKIYLSDSQPNTWRGGILHELWKGKGPIRVCRSYRGIFLIDVLAKCHHAMLRRRLMPLLEKYDPCSQSGSLPQKGTALAVLNLRSLLRLFAVQKQSVACVFLDVKAAFDSVCRCFLVDLRHVGPEVACSRIGLDADQSDSLMRRLLEEGGAPLELADVGRHLRVLTADAITNTWFSTTGVSEIVQTTQGTLPGDPLGDVLYTFMCARLKHEIKLQLFAEDFVLSVQCSAWQDPLGLTSSPESDEVFDATYVDDDEMAFADDDASNLVRKTCRALEISTADLELRAVEI